MKYIKYYSVRGNYSKYGVDRYYQEFGYEYINPHFNYIKILINKLIIENIVDLTKVLDLSSGNGEVTDILTNNGVNNIEACDPYLCDNYRNNFNYRCFDCSFDDIFNGKLNDKYSVIFCSYALHLSDNSKLPNILWNLSLITDHLVILSPNNKPVINNGFDLIYSDRYKKSRIKVYKSKN